MCSVARRLEIRLGEIKGLIELHVATSDRVAAWLFYMNRTTGVLWRVVGEPTLDITCTFCETGTS